MQARSLLWASLLAALVGFSIPRQPPPSSPPSDVDDGWVYAEAIPTRILRRGNRDEMSVRIGVTHKQPAIASEYRYAIVDDTGDLVLSGGGDLAKKPSADITIPASLSDGFYSLKVTVGSLEPKGDAATSEAELNWLMTDGSLAPLSTEEWRSKSHSNQASHHEDE